MLYDFLAEKVRDGNTYLNAGEDQSYGERLAVCLYDAALPHYDEVSDCMHLIPADDGNEEFKIGFITDLEAQRRIRQMINAKNFS